MMVRFSGSLEVDLLTGALNELVSRHDGLRAVFVPNEELPLEARQAAMKRYSRAGVFTPGLYRQVVVAEAGLPVPFLDLSTMPQPARDQALRALSEREHRYGFDPASLPRMRAMVVKLSGTEHLLFIFLDHMVGDGWSMRVIRQEVISLYSSLLKSDGDVPLARPISGSPQYALWQQERAREGYFDAQARFWRDQWAAFGPHRLALSDFPFATAIANAPASAFETAGVEMDPEVSADIRDFAKRSRITLHVFFFTACCILLHCLTGKRKLGVWTHLANRSQPGVSEAIGDFWRTHLVGVEVSDAQSAAELFLEARDRIASARANEEVPLALLWHMLQCRPVSGDVRVLVDTYPAYAEEEYLLPDGTMVTTPDTPEIGTRFSNLGVYIALGKSRLRIKTTVSLARFPQGLAQGLLSELAHVVQEILAEPLKRISEYDLVEMHRTPEREHTPGELEMSEYLLYGAAALPIIAGREVDSVRIRDAAG
jgi:hypothetical protein